jgi:hypothetical protein
VDELFEILAVFGEVDFGCDDWVEPALDYVPDACGNVRIEASCMKWGTNSRRARVPCE